MYLHFKPKLISASLRKVLALSILLGLSGLYSCGDDDSPVSQFMANVSISISSTSLSEDGDDISLTITLSAENNTGVPIEIPLSIGGTATNGQDYQSIANSIQIPNGSNIAQLTIDVIDDSEVEGDETITIGVNTASLPTGISEGTLTSLSLTIEDNDEAIPSDLTVEISGSTTASEDDMRAGFTIALSETNNTQADITVSYTVSGTATAGSDYRAPDGSATIAIGESEVAVNIPLIDDADEEEDETIIVTLSSTLVDGVVLGSNSSLTITLSDNDGTGGSDCTNDNSIDQDNWECDETPSVDNTYSISASGNTRTIVTNGIPNHDFRNQIPQIVSQLNSQSKTFTMNVVPAKASSVTSLTSNGRPQWKFGVATNGVAIDPAPAEPFIFENPNTGEFNYDWVFEPNWNMRAVGLDCAVAHVQPDGTYHYHGDMSVYADVLQNGLGSGSTTPSDPVQIGWAADGFPILYKFGPDASGNIKELLPSYQVKSGERSGDGVTEPCGEYNGKYTNDFEYVSGLGDLDECNGVDREITIDGETFSYFYVITSEFPIISRCLVGDPDRSFRLGGG